MNIMLFLLILFCASYAVINVCVANATIIFRNNDVVWQLYTSTLPYCLIAMVYHVYRFS